MSWNSLHLVDSSGGSDGRQIVILDPASLAGAEDRYDLASVPNAARDFVKQAIAVLEAVPVKSDAALRVDAPAQTPEERALALVLRETLGVRTHE